MGKNVVKIAEFGLFGSENGKVSVTVIKQPYGPNSNPVASIGISLQKDATEPDWKVHLPKENIDEVIAALQKAKEEI